MLCSRSASFTSSTRMSSDMASRNLRRFSAARWLSRLRLDLADSLVTPSTSRATFVAEQLLDLLAGRERVLDRVVEDGGDDRLVVEVQVGEDAGHLDRVAVIRIAGGALLGAVRLHREDVGAVDHRLVGVRIVAPDLLDQFILPQHAPKMGRTRADCASANRCRPEGWGHAPGRRSAAERAPSSVRWRAPDCPLRMRWRCNARGQPTPIARPSTRKLSIRPDFFARAWQTTSGRPFWVEPTSSIGTADTTARRERQIGSRLPVSQALLNRQPRRPARRQATIKVSGKTRRNIERPPVCNCRCSMQLTSQHSCILQLLLFGCLCFSCMVQGGQW